MAAKEPTVERRHLEAARAVLKRQFGNWTEDVPLVAQALASAEAAAAERAWDEGFEAAGKVVHVNPYRAAKERG